MADDEPVLDSNSRTLLECVTHARLEERGFSGSDSIFQLVLLMFSSRTTYMQVSVRRYRTTLLYSSSRFGESQ